MIFIVFLVGFLATEHSCACLQQAYLGVHQTGSSPTIKVSVHSIVDGTLEDDTAKESLRTQADGFLESLSGLTVVEVPATGDIEKAKATATEISEPALDFIQLIVAIYEHESRNIKITPGGDVVGRKPVRLVIADDKSTFGWDQTLAASHRLTLDEEIIKRIIESGFENTVAAIAKDEDERSDFEGMLLNALHWIADAEKQERYENRIRSYMTAMELFFTSKDEPITRDLSENVAYLLGDSLENRFKVKKMVSDLYGKRSAVSHSGARSIVQADALALKDISINVLAKMSRLASNFETKADVQRFFTQLRLSASFDLDTVVQEANQVRDSDR